MVLLMFFLFVCFLKGNHLQPSCHAYLRFLTHRRFLSQCLIRKIMRSGKTQEPTDFEMQLTRNKELSHKKFEQSFKFKNIMEKIAKLLISFQKSQKIQLVSTATYYSLLVNPQPINGKCISFTWLSVCDKMSMAGIPR